MNKTALHAALALSLACFPALPARGETSDHAEEQDIPSINALFKLSTDELDTLYAASPRGEMPDGFGRGKAIVAPGTVLTPPLAFLAGLWRGKVFKAKEGTLHNKGPFGVKIAKAKIYYGESWFDSKPAVIIDYQETSSTFSWIRDEIRPVAPGIYLGRAYNRSNRSLLLYFALDFNKKEPPAEPTVQLQNPWPDQYNP